MAGRTLNRFTRTYVGGYDLSGYTRTLGPLKWEFNLVDATAEQGDSVKGYLPGIPSISPGVLNTVFDNTATSGSHTRLSATNGAPQCVLYAIGDRAAPVAGNPTFGGYFNQLDYKAPIDSGGLVTATVQFGEWNTTYMSSHIKPWGVLLHANSAATDVNSATGVDWWGAASAKGGYMIYQIFAVGGTGNVTITVEDSETGENADFAAITGVTSGAIAHTSVPCAGIVASTVTAIRQYTRWQIALAGGLTSVTFALAFVRGI